MKKQKDIDFAHGWISKLDSAQSSNFSALTNARANLAFLFPFQADGRNDKYTPLGALASLQPGNAAVAAAAAAAAVNPPTAAANNRFASTFQSAHPFQQAGKRHNPPLITG